MEIKGKVHCLFEQSGTFKNEFIKLGYEAYDYDIQNNFGETDYQIDLFAEIEKGYSGELSIFDKVTKDDLVFAFFPCIYFEEMQANYYNLSTNNYGKKETVERISICIDRIKKRTEFHILLYKLLGIAHKRKTRLIIENPATQPHYLLSGNFPKPTLIDKNRMLRGDFFKKPTAYWFINCEQTFGCSYQNNKKQKIINKCKRSKGDGLCSEERSLISPDYARNFICDFILGKTQDFGQYTLF